jgi:hypothetical protein
MASFPKPAASLPELQKPCQIDKLFKINDLGDCVGQFCRGRFQRCGNNYSAELAGLALKVTSR